MNDKRNELATLKLRTPFIKRHHKEQKDVPQTRKSLYSM